MYYSRLRMLGVVGILLISALLCLPNFIKSPSPSLPWHQVHLGLDLRGGSYLLLQLDTKSLQHDRLQALEAETRRDLLNAHLGFLDMTRDDDNASLSFQPRAESEHLADRHVLDNIASATPGELTVTEQDGRLILTLQHDAMKARAREAVSRSIEIVRRRIDSTGALDPTIAREGDDRIILELPGISDPERIKNLLGTTARMTFHLVGPNPTQQTPGTTLLPMQDGKTSLAVQDQVEVDGANLSDAAATRSEGRWAVSLKFDSKGAEDFARITTANVGKLFAIVLDNRILTAPVINSPITAGSGEITGNFTARSASDLALLLRAGALPAPLAVIEQRSIGPSLGAASIRAGMISLAVGFVLVVVFMFLFYARFGWYADIALFANLVLILAILSLFGATLTLPGMAGILLTLGMAVDANILINERIREEVKRGRKPLQALQSGFERATGTIIDSNATAFLAHVMLFVFGTGAVRNFALTITIGIVTTLFTTLIFSRLLIVRWYAHTRPKELPV
ncbi:protein translocase subunit SecD [Saccharibacter sp. 17.LH.SD]|uniref:protein translocase subunit SecD n=1 Tax=Saccharibacter sp. 17.LH.SD TaxID=2689393 RepID=UPI00136EDC63|nr:protein translocase subunit SecD [Saccharibacter sp. 17.LH.SD]MXV43562.1 protein translocase subunit SecD [Saccharibacter sp. 17.LH.SD]